MHDWKQECIHLEQRDGQCRFYDKGCCTSTIPGGCRPLVDECMTAGIEYVSDPRDKEKQIEKRVPCRKIHNGLCSAYVNPAAKWGLGIQCPFAGKMAAEESSKKINPLKASKRAAAGKKA